MKKDIPNLKDVSRIPEELIPVIQWWQRNGTKTLTILAVVLGLSAILYYWKDTSEKNQDAAVVHFSQATIADDFAVVADADQAPSPAAAAAQARSLVNTCEYAAALEICENALDKVEEPSLKAAFTMTKVHALEGEQRFDEALATLETLAPSFLDTEATLVKARLLCQKGDKAAAKEVLAPLVADEATATRAKNLMNIIDAYGKPLATPAPAPVPAPEAPAAPAPAAPAPAQ